MSVRTIETRYCDMCETEYTDRPDWMILTAANAPAETDAQWDFCSYPCLVTWINTDEDEVEEQPQQVVETVPSTPVPQNLQPIRPAMSLADAIASGELNFGRKR